MSPGVIDKLAHKFLYHVSCSINRSLALQAERHAFEMLATAYGAVLFPGSPFYLGEEKSSTPTSSCEPTQLQRQSNLVTIQWPIHGKLFSALRCAGESGVLLSAAEREATAAEKERLMFKIHDAIQKDAKMPVEGRRQATRDPSTILKDERKRKLAINFCNNPSSNMALYRVRNLDQQGCPQRPRTDKRLRYVSSNGPLFALQDQLNAFWLLTAACKAAYYNE